MQDRDGFIWLGTNSGLYRFDGIRYIQYKSETQRANAISGLTMSVCGGLYCFNFLSQIFYVNRDTIYEIPHELNKVNSLATDRDGKLYAAHNNGVSQYDGLKKIWTHYNVDTIPYNEDNRDPSTRIELSTLQDTLRFMYKGGVGEIANDRIAFIATDIFNKLSPGHYTAISHKGTYWIFVRDHEEFYTCTNGVITPLNDPALTTLLKGRKITNVRVLDDHFLWITTYKGIVVYNPTTHEAKLLYHDISFSDVIKDREGSYWLSTLQSGLMRVPKLTYLVWNKFENNRLVKLVNDDQYVYFATLNGTIGRIDIDSHHIDFFNTEMGADVQSLDYDRQRGSVMFNLNNTLYGLHNNKVTVIEALKYPLKSRLVTDYGTISTTSQGTFIGSKQIDSSWSRTIKWGKNCIWITTNNGLLKLELKDNQWVISKKFLVDHQILSIDYDPDNEVLYVIDYFTTIYAFDSHDNMRIVTRLASSIQSYRLVYHKGCIYVSSNNGVYHYNISKQQLKHLNTFSGLVSNNALDIVIVGNGIWLATNKGLQRIPIDDIFHETRLATIRLRFPQHPGSLIKLKNNEPLILVPEVSCYASNGKFEYLYRFNKSNEWYRLPSSMQQLEIQNIPWGDFELELKVVDHLGRDSENTILLKGHANPPLWRNWWLILTISLLFAALVFYIAYIIIRNVRKREHERVELVKSQLTALKAQMNPHFMYNTLNSIQGLILKQDIKSSNLYLSKFSHLMRKVLDASGKEYISLQEDIQILELYLSLEKLRFGSEFNYEIEIDPQLDPYMIQIPPLILQPFAENALKHGLLHKVGDKHLIIKYKLKKDLLCIIEDNGIGRKRAMEIKDRQQDRHESFSSEAIRKRMDLLQSVTNRRFEFKYEDLYVASLAAGTKVVVRIPIPTDMD